MLVVKILFGISALMTGLQIFQGFRNASNNSNSGSSVDALENKKLEQISENVRETETLNDKLNSITIDKNVGISEVQLSSSLTTGQKINVNNVFPSVKTTSILMG